MNEYTFEQTIPTVDDYIALREAVGWGNLSREAIERGLQHTLFAVCVREQGRLIGHGRVVGDGGIVFYIQDVIVLPDHQGRGVGTKIMATIMGYIRPQATAGTTIGLMSAERAVGLYEKFGFKKRPENMPGMELRIS